MYIIGSVGVALFFLFLSFGEGVHSNTGTDERLANRIEFAEKLNQETNDRQSTITTGIDQLQGSVDSIEKNVAGTGDSLKELLNSIERCEQLIRAIQQRSETQGENP